jgi:hypothetical protein
MFGISILKCFVKDSIVFATGITYILVLSVVIGDTLGQFHGIPNISEAVQLWGVFIDYLTP